MSSDSTLFDDLSPFDTFRLPETQPSTDSNPTLMDQLNLLVQELPNDTKIMIFDIPKKPQSIFFSGITHTINQYDFDLNSLTQVDLTEFKSLGEQFCIILMNNQKILLRNTNRSDCQLKANDVLVVNDHITRIPKLLRVRSTTDIYPPQYYLLTLGRYCGEINQMHMVKITKDIHQLLSSKIDEGNDSLEKICFLLMLKIQSFIRTKIGEV